MIAPALLFAILAATPVADRGPEPTLLDFTATWCGPCREMRPAIDALSAKGYRVKPSDIDESPELAKRYEVHSVPTFVMVDPKGRELARTEGFQPATQLAEMYREARAKIIPAEDDRPAEVATATPVEDTEPAPEGRSPANPKPWQTVVRIRVHGNGSIGFGSGTIIHSTADEAIILTCAHIFKLEGKQQAHPSKFPQPVSVDLFDGQIRGRQPAQVLFANESHRGEVIDYNFNTDVGLVRIRAGRRLPASPVVSADWKPKANLPMYAVGCPQGNDATAWSTKITNVSALSVNGHPGYEAIECLTAPIQGRSGGGLYTTDGYLAGVCDFAEPQGNRGLYATPRSIYKLLDKNGMTALYDPTAAAARTQIAANTARAPRPKTSPARPPTIARAQSPDVDEHRQVTIPSPEILGIGDPTQGGSGRIASSIADRPSSGRAKGLTVRTKMERPALLDDDVARPEESQASGVAEVSKTPGNLPIKGHSWKGVR